MLGSELLDGLLEPVAEDRLSAQEAIDIATGKAAKRRSKAAARASSALGAAGAGAGERTMRMPDGSIVKVVGGGAVRPLPRGVKKPAGTRVVLDRSPGRLDLEIPPEGLSGNSVGTGVFAVAWNAFVAVSAGFMCREVWHWVVFVVRHVLATGCIGARGTWAKNMSCAEATRTATFTRLLQLAPKFYSFPLQFWTFSALASGGILFALFSAPFWYAGWQLAGQAFGGALTKERFAVGRNKFRLAQVGGFFLPVVVLLAL